MGSEAGKTEIRVRVRAGNLVGSIVIKVRVRPDAIIGIRHEVVQRQVPEDVPYNQG